MIGILLIVLKLCMAFALPLFLSVRRARQIYIKTGNKNLTTVLCIGIFLLFNAVFERIFYFFIEKFGIFLVFGFSDKPIVLDKSILDNAFYLLIKDWIGVLLVASATLISAFLTSKSIDSLKLGGDSKHVRFSFLSIQFVTVVIVCIFGLAVLLLNLPHDALKAVAKITNSPLVCHVMKINPMRRFHNDTNECVIELAKTSKSPSHCKYYVGEEAHYIGAKSQAVTSTISRDECYVGAAISLGSPEECTSVVSPKNRAACYYEIALKTNNASICDKILELNYARMGGDDEDSPENKKRIKYSKCMVNFPPRDQSRCDELFAKSFMPDIYSCLNKENINRKDPGGYTILMYYIRTSGAGYYDYLADPKNQLLTKIFSFEPDVNLINNNGETALHLLMQHYIRNDYGSNELLDALINRKVRADIRDKDGQTAQEMLDVTWKSISFKDYVKKKILRNQTN